MSVWFSNLRLYRFTKPLHLDPAHFDDSLDAARFHPCGRMERQSTGFTSPLGHDAPSAPLTHRVGSCVLLRVTREERLLPERVVKQAAAERIQTLEEERGLPVRRRERDRIIDDVRFEMLPRAFTHQQHVYGYIDTSAGWLVVDTSSDARADEFTELLAAAIGQLPICFPVTLTRPASVLTEWVARGTVPDDIELEDECELRLPVEGGAVVRCRNQDLASREIATHLEAGKEVVRAAVTYADRLRFVIDEKLHIRRLRFLELVQEEAGDIEAEGPAARIDADFSVVSLELRQLLARLMEWFGGEDREAMGMPS